MTNNDVVSLKDNVTCALYLTEDIDLGKSLASAGSNNFALNSISLFAQKVGALKKYLYWISLPNVYCHVKTRQVG